MNIVLDLIVVAIVIITTLITMKKGFVKSILSLASLILTILIISTFGEMIASTVYSSFIEKGIVSSVETALSQQMESGEAEIDGVFDSLPSFIAKSAEKNGVGAESVMQGISQGKTPNDIALSVNNDVVKPLVLPLLLIIIDVVMFTVLMFVFRILSKMICALFKAPVLKNVNKAMGAILGIVKGLLISVIVCSIISFVVIYNFGGEFLIFTEDAIEGSYLFGKLAGILNLTAFSS